MYIFTFTCMVTLDHFYLYVHVHVHVDMHVYTCTCTLYMYMCMSMCFIIHVHVVFGTKCVYNIHVHVQCIYVHENSLPFFPARYRRGRCSYAPHTGQNCIKETPRPIQDSQWTISGSYTYMYMYMELHVHVYSTLVHVYGNTCTCV